MRPAAHPRIRAPRRCPAKCQSRHRCPQGKACKHFGSRRRPSGPKITPKVVYVIDAIAEVGAIIVVGGNIDGFTRTMTTAIALETGKGDLPLALGLGIILLTISGIVSTMAFLLVSRVGKK